MTTPNPLLQPTFLIWCIFCGESLALAMALAPGLDGNRAIWFGLHSLFVQWVIAMTLMIIHLLRRPFSKLSDSSHARACLCILLIATAVTVCLFWWVFPAELRLSSNSLGQRLAASCTIALLFGLLGMGMLQNHLRLQRLAIQSVQARLQALQARIKPHFLFNTLNSAVALVRSQPSRAENVLLDLADLFRTALSETDAISLNHEIELCQRYVAIEQERFGDRLVVEWDLPCRLPNASVPPLCLQPLLENAIHHGVEPSTDQVTVKVSIINTENEALSISVTNPLPHDQPIRPTRHAGHQLGLEAVHIRLSARDPDARLTTFKQDGQFTARLHIPLRDQVTTR